MPFEVRTSQMQATGLTDFKQDTIYKCKNESFTWFFCLDQQDVIPYLVCESDAWAVFGKIVNVKLKLKNKLFDNDKLVYENRETIIDISEVKSKLFLLHNLEVVVLSKGFKIETKVALRTFGGRFLSPTGTLVVC